MRIMKLSRPKSEARQGECEMLSSRRIFLRRLGLGALVTGLAGQLFAFVRALVPNVLYEPPKTFKIGTPDNFAQGVT